MRNSPKTLTAACLAALSLLIFSACDKPFDDTRDPIPLIPREIYPVDSLLVDKGEPLTISVRFNRPTRAEELNIRVFPEPLSQPSVRLSPTGHTAYFDGLLFNPNKNIHYLLVDGVDVRTPQLRRYWDGETSVAAITGWIGTENSAITDGVHTALFLMEQDTEFRADLPETFSAAQPIAVELPRWSTGEQALSFRFGDLIHGLYYFLIAIADVNRDGIYDPAVDWWGSHADSQHPTELVPVEATVSNLSAPRRMYRFNLHPPVQ